jgi:hypothetical protein
MRAPSPPSQSTADGRRRPANVPPRRDAPRRPGCERVVHEGRLPRRAPGGSRLPLSRVAGARARVGAPGRRLLPELGCRQCGQPAARSRRAVRRRGARGDGGARADGAQHPRGVWRLRRLRPALQPDVRGDRVHRSGARGLLRRAPVDRLQGDRAVRHRGAEARVAAALCQWRGDRRLLPHRARLGLRCAGDAGDRRPERGRLALPVERHEDLDLERGIRRGLHRVRKGPGRGARGRRSSA